MNLIYKITNIINGKSYIGKTSKTLEQRFSEHIKDNTPINFNTINGTPVYQKDKTGNILNSFISQREAARFLKESGITKANISAIATNIGRVLSCERKTCLGFYWSTE